MAWGYRSGGGFSTWFNTSGTPGAPAGFAAGDLLLLFCGEYLGTDPAPSISGWTKLTPDTKPQHGAQLYGRIAVGSDSMPTFNYGNQFQFGQVFAFTGAPASISGIVHASVDRTSNQTTSIVNPGALTISQNNCLIIFDGQRNKTSASDGTVYSLSGTQGANFTIPTGGQFATNGNSQNSAAFSYWIQTGATSLDSTAILGGSASDGSGQTMNCNFVALLPAVTPGNIGPTPWHDIGGMASVVAM
jgi:hypothetical protein